LHIKKEAPREGANAPVRSEREQGRRKKIKPNNAKKKKERHEQTIEKGLYFLGGEGVGTREGKKRDHHDTESSTSRGWKRDIVFRTVLQG